MLVLRKTTGFFGTIDGSGIRPDLLCSLSISEIHATVITTELGPVMLGQVFDISGVPSILEQSILMVGDCEAIDNLGQNMESGILCVVGSVGDYAGREMRGGKMIIAGNARDHLGSGMQDGFIYISGNCENGLASPRPGRKSGMRGGDIFIAGNVGARACERMRRGTVFVSGDAGSFAASQMIAGSFVVMGNLGGQWGGGMRRGSIILGTDPSRDNTSQPTASLSAPRDFELSFLPLVWSHIERNQSDALEILGIAMAISEEWSLTTARHIPTPVKIPRTRWVQRQIGDLNFNGRGEVLVLRRISSPGVVGWHRPQELIRD